MNYPAASHGLSKARQGHKDLLEGSPRVSTRGAMKIIWSPLAIDRVSEIAAYIAQENPAAAEKWVDLVFRKVKDLQSFPESGRIVPETENKTIRELIYGNYRLIYRLEEKRISMLTVRHGKQILPVDEITA
jgi:toxin ParE1/3/4